MMCSHTGPSKQRQKGYSLVEIVVVMAVIGLLIGGVTMGREVMREAEYKRIYNKFILPWKQSYDLYYQRTGIVIGDSQVAPTLMVNGAEAHLNNRLGGVAGIPANYLNKGMRICHGAGHPRNTVGQGDPALSPQNLHTLFDNAGIGMPPGRAEGQEDRYVYQDQNGNPVELQICFQWNPDKTISGSGNTMVIRGLTPDLARQMDQLIDGKADALEGRFRQQNASSNALQASSQRPGYEWNTNNTYTVVDINTQAKGQGNASNNDRTALVTAHWSMDR